MSIQPSFWLFLIFFTNIYRGITPESLILGGVFTFSLLVHEYGHALTAQCFGAKPTITLEAFGGSAQYNSFGMSPKQQFIITLNGPLLESVLIGLSYYLLKTDISQNYYMHYFLYATLKLNILWCLLNLIPVAPLDGGYLLRYFLEKHFGDKGERACLFIGVTCALLIVPYLYYQDFFFFAVLLAIYGLQNFQMLRQSKRPSPEQNHFSRYLKGVEAIKSNDLESAKAILKKLLKSQNAHIQHSAVESLAKIYVQENEPEKSYELLLKSNHQNLKEGKSLLCKLAFDRKNYDLIKTYSSDIYAIEPSYEIALLNSKTFAHLNEPALAGGWLETASLFNAECKNNAKEALSSAIYDGVRDHEEFKQYAERIYDNTPNSIAFELNER